MHSDPQFPGDPRVPFLQQWDAGRRDMPMPPVLHALLASHLRAQEAR